MPEMLGRLKAASGAAVAHQGFCGVIKRALHELVVLFGAQRFTRHPAGGSYERGLTLQVLYVHWRAEAGFWSSLTRASITSTEGMRA